MSVIFRQIVSELSTVRPLIFFKTVWIEYSWLLKTKTNIEKKYLKSSFSSEVTALLTDFMLSLFMHN